MSDKYITVLDTYACSENLGDQIIMDAVKKQVHGIFPFVYKVFIPTHEYIGKIGYRLIKKADYIFVGGTNLLTSNMNKYNQWRISYKDYFMLKNVVLMGVGWWQYQGRPNLYTRTLLKKVLHKGMIHSVRDNYTVSQLKKAGITNVINTGCPTMWELSPEHCRRIPADKGENLLLTFTDYKPSPQIDRKIFVALKRKYNKIYFWLQGSRDYEYVRNIISKNGVEIIPPSLEALDEVLFSIESLDYIGTRLHAGIRAMQFGKRSIILGVDNRAVEKARDFGINMIMRENVESLDKIVESKLPTKIVLPDKDIMAWKKQFEGSATNIM